MCNDVRKPPTPMEMAPAMSSATPPSTTSFDSPRLESPAVNANGTVNPSDNPITLQKEENFFSTTLFANPERSTVKRVDGSGQPPNTNMNVTYTSRTTSGSMSCLSSSPLSSLQQTPSLILLFLSHLTGNGASASAVGALATAQIGGWLLSASVVSRCRRGSGTEGAVMFCL